MKKIFFSAVLITTAFVQQSISQDSAKTQPSPLLTSYYAIKDALVGSNANDAAASAGEFVKAINSLEKGFLKEEILSSLLKDAVAISQTNNLNLQRETFATLSLNIFSLAKRVKLSAEPVYQQYCPMKKASWLSNDKAIKNPYYGSVMLTCGSVKETL
jgi:Protein of unknown function (DUF3347)